LNESQDREEALIDMVVDEKDLHEMTNKSLNTALNNERLKADVNLKKAISVEKDKVSS